MPVYARLLLVIIGIGLVVINGWYLRKGFKSIKGFKTRSLEEALGFDPNNDNYLKPGRRDDSRLQFWILIMGNIVGVFLAFVIIISFITNDVTVLINYAETHPAATVTHANPETDHDSK